MATTQDQRTLQLTTPLGKDYLLINRLRCTEGLNELFRIELDMLHEEIPDSTTLTVIEPEALLGKPMVVVAIQDPMGGESIERYFHGICVNFTQGVRHGWFTGFRATLVPRIWLLTQVSQSRIFQNISVPDILRKVFEGFDYDLEIQGTFEPRNYCVQYRESDWDFASRLMEEEGIYYYFEHTANSHRLILANTPASHRPCPSLSKVGFALDKAGGWIPSIFTWQVDSSIRTGRYELGDFSFQLPNHKLEARHTSLFNAGDNRKLENYDWTGGYAKRFDGIDAGGGERPAELNKIFSDRERTVRIRQEEIDVSYKTIYGSGDCCTLTAGHKFEFADHPIKKNNINHILVHVEHDADQSPNYVADRPVNRAYNINFTCIPHGEGHAPFRPARRTGKPILHGGQTAFVVGTPGQEIFTDKYGRVKVQFHWDRSGRMDGGSSCWLRVAQGWAGNGWGSMFIPRIGMEVMVHFLEGDPDQPIITGCVYNAANMPPYKLPEHKTRSGIKTGSTVGSKGFNELRFEDKRGKEQIFIHAEKDQDIRVKEDCMETIGSSRHLIVGGDQREKVYGDKHLRVAGDLYEKIESSTSLQVGGDKDEKVGSKYALESGKEIHLKAGMKVIIEAGVQLTLKGPGGFIDIGPGGVTVQGTMVLINSGGSAGSGSGASPTSPKAPREADEAEGGKASEAPEAPPPPPSTALAKLKVAAKKAKKKKETAKRQLPPEIVRAEYHLHRDLMARRGIRAVLAAKDGLPFVDNSPPSPAQVKQLKTDEDYFEVAEQTGLPVAGPDGSIYTANPRIKQKREGGPEGEEKQEAMDDYYWGLAEKNGKPVKSSDGWIYDVPSGRVRNKKQPATEEERKRFAEEDKRQTQTL